MTLAKRLGAPLLLVGLMTPFLANCAALKGGLGAAGDIADTVDAAQCKELMNGNIQDFKIDGNAKLTGRVQGFLEAAVSLDAMSIELETTLINSCRVIGKSLKMSDDELKGDPDGGEGAKKLCESVGAKLESALSAAGSLTFEIKEPRCEVPVEAFMACLDGCGSPVEPGQIEASCEGGEIVGKCDAECKGSCVVEAGADCKGTCNGTCNGKCDGKDSKGSCAGKCEGSCSAQCEIKGQASCKGTCTGGCSAKIKAPSCTGDFTPPSVDAECHANCSSKLAKQVVCHPPAMSIKAEGKANADLQAIIDGLQVALPNIITVNVALGKKLKGYASGTVEIASSLPEVVTDAGVKAIACVAMAGKMVAGASASISVNVEVSASASGSAGVN